ncbi:MAG: hypothetical protein R3D59_13000 [Paracoccaceae bacterium]
MRLPVECEVAAREATGERLGVTPSKSSPPADSGRVMTRRTSRTDGTRAANARISVSLPTPEGPTMAKIRLMPHVAE